MLDKTTQQQIRERTLSLFAYWLVVFAGTATAGAVFGPLISGLDGFLVGFWFALFVAIPVIATVALTAWALLLSRHRLLWQRRRDPQPA
jgi:hypothetical protein